jgi:hypothetical protein
MHGGDPEVDRVTELSCWKIANALIERRSVMESRQCLQIQSTWM